MVTAEMAAALPALVLVIVLALWVVAVGMAQLRVADAAREAARAAARGDDPAIVQELAEEAAPAGAIVTVSERDGVITVDVSAQIAPPVPFGDKLPALTVRADAAALEESP
jgi:Flp pilus assembly protein TadG